MKRERLEEIFASGGLTLPESIAVDVRGQDPVYEARFPIGEIAAVAMAACGAQGRAPLEIDLPASPARLGAPGCGAWISRGGVGAALTQRLRRCQDRVMARAVIGRLLELLNSRFDGNDEHSLLGNIREVDAAGWRR